LNFKNVSFFKGPLSWKKSVGKSSTHSFSSIWRMNNQVEEKGGYGFKERKKKFHLLQILFFFLYFSVAGCWKKNDSRLPTQKHFFFVFFFFFAGRVITSVGLVRAFWADDVNLLDFIFSPPRSSLLFFLYTQRQYASSTINIFKFWTFFILKKQKTNWL
jgi:hypothetical protein